MKAITLDYQVMAIHAPREAWFNAIKTISAIAFKHFLYSHFATYMIYAHARVLLRKFRLG